MHVAVIAPGQAIQRWVGYVLKVSQLAGPPSILKLPCHMSKTAVNCIDSDFFVTWFPFAAIADRIAKTGEQLHYGLCFLIAGESLRPAAFRVIVVPLLSRNTQAMQL